MDLILILHADHEQNASTSTVRLAGSTGANPVRLHRGRHRQPLGLPRMRRQRGGTEDADRDRLGGTHPRLHREGEDKNSHVRLMGFGHRVYKNYDPRAKIMQATCHAVLAELGIKDDPLLDLAIEMERIALHDPYFVDRKLYPNVDFYSGIILKAMGFPTSMFTVLFAWRAQSAGSASGRR